jgi:hypothetical protein
LKSVTLKDSISNVQDNIHVEICDSDDTGEQRLETLVEFVKILAIRITNKSKNPISIFSYHINLEDLDLVLGITLSKVI